MAAQAKEMKIQPAVLKPGSAPAPVCGMIAVGKNNSMTNPFTIGSGMNRILVMKRAEFSGGTETMREKTTIVQATGEQKLITRKAGVSFKQEQGGAIKEPRA